MDMIVIEMIAFKLIVILLGAMGGAALHAWVDREAKGTESFNNRRMAYICATMLSMSLAI